MSEQNIKKYENIKGIGKFWFSMWVNMSRCHQYFKNMINKDYNSHTILRDTCLSQSQNESLLVLALDIWPRSRSNIFTLLLETHDSIEF